VKEKRSTWHESEESDKSRTAEGDRKRRRKTTEATVNAASDGQHTSTKHEPHKREIETKKGSEIYARGIAIEKRKRKKKALV
jgi:hypothetical protein